MFDKMDIKPSKSHSGEGKMTRKIFGLLVVVSMILCCASPGTKQAKIYEGKLETMIGNKTSELEANFKDWGFNLMDTWQEENPSVEAVKEHNRPIVKFSDAEISAIFSEEGKYHVQCYQKKEATSDASIGTIGEGGMSYMGDTAMASDRYTVVRVVYKDGQLAHFKLWGNIHQTQISGWRTIRR
jgi:hypothetical protein